MLTKKEEVRRAIEGMSRSMKLGEVTTLEIFEGVVEYAVNEAVRCGLSVIDAYEKDGVIVLIIEKRF